MFHCKENTNDIIYPTNITLCLKTHEHMANDIFTKVTRIEWHV